MDVPVIEMDQDEAASAREEYATGLKKRYDEEHAAVLRGLESLAAGERVISLRAAFEAADFDENTGLPELAIARADRRWCRLEMHRYSSTIQFDTRAPSNTIESDTLQVRFDLLTHAGRYFSDDEQPNWNWRNIAEWWALVPMIPPLGVRLAGGGSHLREHFVLWEVDEWSSSRPDALAPYDPYLLRPLGGDLYAVVHEWDLTVIERAVMAGRTAG